MPNYSHGTKMTLAAADEPPYLTVGTDVSAKYKGAFCEAKIIDVNKNVKLRVLFDGTSGSHLIDYTELKAGSSLEVGAKIEAKHPEKKQQNYLPGTVNKILDLSRYTVVFDDGDQCILKRNHLCLKSGKHFAESETLDQLPLTNPEHFGNPVKAEQFNHNELQHPNQAINRINANNNNVSGSTNNNIGSYSNSASGSATTNGRTAQGASVKQEKHDDERPSKSKTSSATSSNAVVATAGTPGRRGGVKGRKRRESTSNNAKQTPDVDDDLNDSSQDSADPDPSESRVNYDLIEIGVKLMVQYGKGKVQNVYEAKVNKIEENSAGRIRYFVHYTGWNNRYDEWITKNRILSIVIERENGVKDGRSKQQSSESVAVEKNSTVAHNSSANNKEVAGSAKEKEKDSLAAAAATTAIKTPRRSRLADTSSAAATKPVTSTLAILATTTTATTSTSTTTSTNSVTSATAATPDRTRHKEKDVPAKTRRSRLAVDSSANSAATSSSASSTSSITSSANNNLATTSKEEASESVAPASSSSSKSGRPRQSETHATNASDSTSSSIPSSKDKEPPTKTRRSKQIDVSSTNQLSNTQVESSVPASPPKAHSERDRLKEPEPPEPTKQQQQSKSGSSAPNAGARSTSTSKNGPASPITKEKDLDKEPPIVAAKTRGTRQSEIPPTATAPVVPTAAPVTPTSSASSTTSSSASTTTTSTTTTVAAVCTSSATSKATVISSPVVSAASLPLKDQERDREPDRDQPPTKIRRSRQPPPETTSNSSIGTTTNSTTSAAASVSATTTSTCPSIATTSTSTTATSAHPSNSSAASSTSSSSSSSSSSMTYTSNLLSSFAVIDREKFKDLPQIDEPDCDKRISILQDKILSIKQTYMALRSELADLDRKKKRPRLERSNSDHINYNSVACRN